MTCSAGVPGGNPSVLLLNRLRALDDKGDQHLVLLKKGHGMTYLTGIIPVLAFLPGLECLLHEMTGRAEIRVFLGIAVITVCQDTPDDRDQEEQDNNGFLVLLYETDKTGGFVRHALPSLPVQKPEEFVQEERKDISHKGAECGENSEDEDKDQTYNDAL